MSEEQTEKKKSFTMLPNSVFLGYGLDNNYIAYYAWLKMICGDNGTCYRSLRSLSELTGFSTGQLSKMNRRLHELGLIHAAKQKCLDKDGKETKWPVWHISIVDIWQKNAAYFAGKPPKNCSPDEHMRQTTVHQMNTLTQSVQDMNGSDESVHGVNDSVQEVNTSGENCSPDDDNKDLGNHQYPNEQEEGGKEGQDDEQSAPTPPDFSNQSETFPVEEKKTHKQRVSEIENLVTTILKRRPMCTTKNTNGLTLLAQREYSDEEIRQAFGAMDAYELSKPDLIFFLAEIIDGKLLGISQGKTGQNGQNGHKKGKPPSSSSSPPSFEPDKEATKRHVEEMRQRNRAKGLVPAGGGT